MTTAAERDRILEIFRAETAENLSRMERALVAMESAGAASPELLNEIFRVAHTLKGDAASLGFGPLASFSHELESALDELRAGARQPSTETVSALLAAVDVVRMLVARGETGADALPAQALRVLEALAATEVVLAPAPSVLPVVEDRTAVASSRVRTLRVPVERLDRMLDLTGEVDIARSRLASLLADPSVPRDALVEANEEMDRLFTDLQELVMKARLVPLASLFNQQMRAVRDLCTTCGKRAELEVEGADVEVDTAIFEHLRDPLTHLLRNAIDHGIESEERRLRAGKSPVGRLRLRAAREGATIVVELCDDGAGLDPKRIADRARELELHPEPERLPLPELYRLVLHPGFSTASKVTMLSGRGVGLDIVQQNLEALRGTLSLSSEPGQGLRVALRFPLTLALIEGFAVRVGIESYILPLDAVLECLELPGDLGPSNLLNLRGEALPFLRLGELFEVPSSASGRENVIVVQHAGRRLGLVVDALLGQGQAVVKPLGRAVNAGRGIAGSAIRGDGRVALILDLNDLLEHALRQTGRGEATPEAVVDL